MEQLSWGQVCDYDFPPAKAAFERVLIDGPEEQRRSAEYALERFANRERLKQPPK
jgi:hypothetical protein